MRTGETQTIPKFYSVGVGPGDPKLLTIKAAEVISGCDIVAVPQSGGSENLALKTAEQYVAGKQIIVCDMPMIRDKQKLDEYHDAVAVQISEHLNSGKTVAFLTIGDPSIYSTTMYIHKRLKAQGFDTQIIPGVTSFSAAAASLDEPLCEGGEQLHIIPASYKGVDEGLSQSGTKVLMKSGKSITELREKLKPGVRAYVVERASMENEKVCSIEEVDENTSYFTVVIVKESGGDE